MRYESFNLDANEKMARQARFFESFFRAIKDMTDAKKEISL